MGPKIGGAPKMVIKINNNDKPLKNTHLSFQVP
jgi:hypothetical protein